MTWFPSVAPRVFHAATHAAGPLLAAARYLDGRLPHADWVVLDGVGHCPQLDVPLETAELVLGFTAR